MDRLDEDVLFVLFSYLPNFHDLVRCSMVCKRWRIILNRDSALWKQALHNEAPEEFITDKLIQSIKSPKAKLMAYLYAWSDKDRSNNIELKPNKLTLHRKPVAQSTDGIRGKRGFTRGQHYWNIIWHGPSFGSNAVVGVATKSCPLSGDGYYSLLGSDSEGWGWDLSKKTLQHSGERQGDYPRVAGIEVSTVQSLYLCNFLIRITLSPNTFTCTALRD